MPEDTPVNGYGRVLAEFTETEIDLIVRLKRFFEVVQGDPEFTKAFTAGSFSPEQKTRLQQIGVTFDVRELALFWEDSGLHLEILQGCACGNEALALEIRKKLQKAPLIDLWFRYAAHKNAVYHQFRRTVFRVPKNPQFDAWRMRRVAAAKSELGHFGHVIDHPILAFELGDGCSVGCWFCAFAARKLTTNLEYPKYRGFFQEVVSSCAELFGPDQASMALLYYGTEPHDNPNYLDFLKDFKAITGHPTCTSTAVPGDAEWLRSLIAFYRQDNLPWPRLSVLTRAMMHRIHDLYTPDELRDVELLMQMKDHSREKVTGGRIVAEHQGMKDREDGQYLENIVPQGSIACVSGFLINMVNRTIQVVSPCYTSKQWIYGYRIFASANFTDAADFPAAIRNLIDRTMASAPRSECTARFRDDLLYKPTEQGFDLVSPNQIHHFTGREVQGPLGAMIAAGDRCYAQVYNDMTSIKGVNPLLAGMAVQRLFDGGFLDEIWAV